jgi:hypothetical protein
MDKLIEHLYKVIGKEKGISKIIATDSQILKEFLICESVAQKIEAELRGIKPKSLIV